MCVRVVLHKLPVNLITIRSLFSPFQPPRSESQSAYSNMCNVSVPELIETLAEERGLSRGMFWHPAGRRRSSCFLL